MDGVLSTRIGTAPGAGNEISETVPDGVQWIVLSMRFPLVTSSAVANRQVSIQITDGDNVVYESLFAARQTASATHVYLVTPIGGGAGDDPTKHIISMPTMRLGSGWEIQTSTLNLQTADGRYGRFSEYDS
jgi:hypothetical protein